MKKHAHKKSPAKPQNMLDRLKNIRMPSNSLLEFVLGFIAAVAISFLLATVFREQIYDFVVGLTGG